MERFDDLDTVDLGVASEETRGGIVLGNEDGGRLPATGIADDD